MGLLSDPEYGSLRWVRILKRFHTLFSFVCYIGGLSWFFLLACKEFNNETYFSENALLPGLATNEFNAESANQFHNEFLRELEDKYDNTDEMPVDWLIAKMAQLHLEVYTHNFTLDYPLGLGQTFVGTNVYGILRAPRTSSLEALVISAPYRPLSSHLKGTTAGIALMLAFAQFARPQKYWAKDIIFLITEHEQLGMQAWLEAYHGLHNDPDNFYTSLGSFYKPGMPTLDLGKLLGFQSKFGHGKCLNPGKLTGRSGSIQAAINLELHTPKIKYIAVEVEGLNGQLPNLDLVNLVLKLCMKSGIHHSFKSSYSWMRNRHKGDDWYTSINTMLRMAQAQVTGVPNGNHGLFHRFGIEAVTLVGRDASDDVTAPKVNALSSANFYRLGNALESIMRSMNNLLERFHQSYFFYMLSATNRFISIGQYMPSLCLMCVALLVRALGFWVGIQKDLDDEPDSLTKDNQKSGKSDSEETKEIESDENNSEKDSKQSDSRDETISKLPGDQKQYGVSNKGTDRKAEGKTKTELSFSITNIATNFLLVHFLGYNALTWPFYSTWLGALFNLPSETSVFSGLAILSVVATILVAVIPNLFRSKTFTQEELTLINILVLVELATALLAIGMHNFPLGFFLATVMTPVALVIKVRGDDDMSTFRARAQGAFCLFHQPLLALTAGMVLYAWILFPEEKYQAIIERGLGAVAQAIMFSVVDSLIYGNWVFNVVTQVIFPVWLIFWQVTCLPPRLPTCGTLDGSSKKRDKQSKKCR